MSGFSFYSNLPLLIVGIILAGLCFGTTLSVFPAITVDQFGLKNYSTNYGVMYMAFGGAGLAAPAIASYFLDVSGNYNAVYMICASGMVVMVIVNFLTRRVIAKEKQQ
jgi:MFS family permease